MKQVRNNNQKKTEDNLGTIGCAVIAAIALVIIVMPFRIYSSLNALSSMTADRVQQDLDAPFNVPALRSSSTTQLIRNIPRKSFDIGYAITGRLWGWNDAVLNEGASAVISYSNSPVQIRFRFPHAFQTLGGNWRGGAARLITTGAMDFVVTGIPGNPDGRWGGAFGVSSELKYASPYFDIEIPFDTINNADDIDGRKLSIVVELDIEYPTYSSSSAYEDRSRTLTHNFEVTVLTPDEASEYESVRKGYLLRQMPLVVLIWLAGPAFGILFLKLTKRFG